MGRNETINAAQHRINLAAIWFVIMIDRTMKAAGIARWPLALVRADNTVTDHAS